MASQPLTFRRRSEPASWDVDRGQLMVPAFVAASVIAHVVVWIVLATLPGTGIELTFEDTTVELELAPLPEPEPEPMIAPEPEPEPEPAPEPMAERPEPEPEVTPPPTVLPEDVGVHSVEDGLAVDAVEASGDGGGILAARPVEPAPRIVPTPAPEPAAPAVDHRRLARDWMLEVNRTVMQRAIRDYPRAARRAHLEGTVIVAITVDARGRITGVDVERGAGEETLDRAAIAAVQAVGTLPPPPHIFNQRARPLTMPISYRLR